MNTSSYKKEFITECDSIITTLSEAYGPLVTIQNALAKTFEVFPPDPSRINKLFEIPFHSTIKFRAGMSYNRENLIKIMQNIDNEEDAKSIMNALRAGEDILESTVFQDISYSLVCSRECPTSPFLLKIKRMDGSTHIYFNGKKFWDEDSDTFPHDGYKKLLVDIAGFRDSYVFPLFEKPTDGIIKFCSTYLELAPYIARLLPKIKEELDKCHSEFKDFLKDSE